MCAQVGGRRKLGHSDAVFRTSGGARLRALHLAEYLDTQRWRLTKTRMETKAVLVGILRGDGRHRARHPRRARVRASAVHGNRRR